MKALIVEIKRKYCIIVTPDGRFLKMAMPAGKYEIGDEISIDANKAVIKKTAHKFSFGIPAKIAAGFAVAAILATGTYFSARYAGNIGKVTTMVASAQEEAMDSEKALQKDNQQQKALTNVQDLSASLPGDSAATVEGTGQQLKDSGIAGTENQGDPQETSINQQEGNSGSSAQNANESGNDSGEIQNTAPADVGAYPLLFEGYFGLDITGNSSDEFVPAGFTELDISYRIEKYATGQTNDPGGPGILWLQTKNIIKNMLYNGNITISFLDESNSALDNRSIEFINFGYGGTKLEKLYFGPGFVSFYLMVYGEIK